MELYYIYHNSSTLKYKFMADLLSNINGVVRKTNVFPDRYYLPLSYKDIDAIYKMVNQFDNNIMTPDETNIFRFINETRVFDAIENKYQPFDKMVDRIEKDGFNAGTKNRSFDVLAVEEFYQYLIKHDLIDELYSLKFIPIYMVQELFAFWLMANLKGKRYRVL